MYKRYPSPQRGAQESLLSAPKHNHKTQEISDFQRHYHNSHALKNITPLGSLTPHTQKTTTMVDKVPLLLTMPLGLLFILKCQRMYFFKAVHI